MTDSDIGLNLSDYSFYLLIIWRFGNRYCLFNQKHFACH